MQIWSSLFDSNGFIPRAQCGNWTPALIGLHNISDFFIWAAYLAIPIVLVRFAAKRRGDLPFQQVFLLFGLFIVACGTTHFMDIVLFYKPMYRLAGVIKLVTAVASWGTVIALWDIVPRALAMRSPEVLEAEITERQRAEQEVRELNATLEARVLERTRELEVAYAAQEGLLRREQQARQDAEIANRAKDDFLATVSHELRTPLNSVVGWAYLLEQAKGEEIRTEAVKTIKHSAAAQLKIIDDILDASRFALGRFHFDMQPVDLSSVVHTSLGAIRPALDAKAIKTSLHIGSSPVVVVADPDRLQQVVWNILNNAVKFTPRDGYIEVRVTHREGLAEMTITDSGKGIIAEFLPHVFERFSQADSSISRSHGGLGLGLSIVKDIVETHGGTVAVDSAGEGKGTCFTLHLPSIAADELRAKSRPAMGVSADPIQTETQVESNGVHRNSLLQLNGFHVLVVDDDPGTLRVVTKTLELQGAQVVLATSTAEATAALQTSVPDIVVSDIGMPGEDGIELIRRVRSHENPAVRSLPALALSAFAGVNDKQRSVDAGYQIHLSKPVAPDVLVATIRQLLEGVKAQ